VDYAELCDVFRIKVNAARAAHVEGVRTGKALAEPMTAVTDTGVRTGDPRAAERRRVAEIDGATGTGTVKVPVKGPKGRSKLEDVVASEDNVRRSLAYWKKRHTALTAVARKRGESTASDATRQCDDMIADMFRRLEAMRGGSAVLDAREADIAAVHRGPTLIRGRAIEAAVVKAPRERTNDKPVRTVLEGPLGRERFDRTILAVPEPAPVLSASQKRARRRTKCRDAYTARTAGSATRS
jgi:hypothetical protein